MRYFDTHTHAISPDTEAFPPKPLGGTRSEWSQTRPVDVDGLIRSLDEAGVEQAALVHASTVYGFDNSYAAAALARYPDRLVGVGAVNFLADSAVADLRELIEERGFSGVRIRVSDGTTKVPTPGSGVTDERMEGVWDYVTSNGIPVCVQMHSKDALKLAQVLERRPTMTVLLDHLGRPNAADGAPYPHLDELGQLARFSGVHLKITPPALKRLGDEPGANVTEVLGRLIETFGADRIMWGSNFPASAGTLSQLRASIEDSLPVLDDEQRAAILGGNAARVYTAKVSAR
ncbi:amidohydrolase family protein [Sinomonas humi]|uniref:Hydrolase n=1 Tax=Sinomonas humi TaxID=1338436 RepID=A0A0B2AMJ0_9MICC|nr:amidohydrolase family protein [Sinomonas humi]KHL02940.1 hydrolase [Sinomonas humi]